MRDDQYQRLQALTEKLMDVLLVEADPANWSGAGVDPARMDKQTRGDRYYDKKNAAATLTLTMRATTLIGVIQRRTADGELPLAAGDEPRAESEDELEEKELARFEKKAAGMLEQLKKKGFKTQA